MTIHLNEIAIEILKDISDNKALSENNYRLDREIFWDIIYALQDDGKIKDAKFSRGGRGNKILIGFLENVKLTEKGMQYLKENIDDMASDAKPTNSI